MPNVLVPAWYLRNGRINAAETQLDAASSSCERWGIWCAALVVFSVIAELVIAFIEPPYNLFLKLSALTDAAVAIGIIGEVLFGMWDSRIQTELRKRSNDKLGTAEKTAGEANARAAQAELRLEELRSRVGPRVIDRTKFLDALKGKPTPTSVQVRHVIDVQNGFGTGFQLIELLREAGWNSVSHLPFPLEKDSPYLKWAPQMFMRDNDDRTKLLSRSGVFVISGRNDLGLNEGAATWLRVALSDALGSSGGVALPEIPTGEILVLIFGRA